MTYGGEGRRVFVLALLCLLLAAQSAGFTSANQQHRSDDHCCLLCHVGPLPFLHTNTSVVVEPAFSIVWREPAQESIATVDVLLSAISSRGPPVSSLAI